MTFVSIVSLKGKHPKPFYADWIITFRFRRI